MTKSLEKVKSFYQYLNTQYFFARLKNIEISLSTKLQIDAKIKFIINLAPLLLIYLGYFS